MCLSIHLGMSCEQTHLCVSFLTSERSRKEVDVITVPDSATTVVSSYRLRRSYHTRISMLWSIIRWYCVCVRLTAVRSTSQRLRWTSQSTSRTISSALTTRLTTLQPMRWCTSSQRGHWWPPSLSGGWLLVLPMGRQAVGRHM